MSEESKEAPEVKKKGKLPVILMLIVLLGGGGFFGLKMKGGGPKKVVVKAAEAAIPFDKEFLINLAGNANNYLRVEISLEVRDDFKKEALDANMPAVKDAVIQIFRSKTLNQVAAGETDALQTEIAAAINAILVSHMTEEEKKAQEAFEKAAKPEPKQADQKKDATKQEWECPAGPVLNVYFTSFTTQ